MHIISYRSNPKTKWTILGQMKYRNVTYYPEILAHQEHIVPATIIPATRTLLNSLSTMIFDTKEEAIKEALSTFANSPNKFKRTNPFNKFFFFKNILYIQYMNAASFVYFNGIQDLCHYRYFFIPIPCNPDTQQPLSLPEDLFSSQKPHRLNFNLFDPITPLPSSLTDLINF